MARREPPTGSAHGVDRELELLADLLTARRGPSPTSRAQTDVYVTDNPPTVTIMIDAAGLNPETLRVVLDGQVLSVVGERIRPSATGRRVYQHAEIDWGSFERHVRLSDPVDPNGADVRYEDGLLRIALPLAKRQVAARVLIGVRLGGR
jgi:HSP20 family molecular chaperone IbpA